MEKYKISIIVPVYNVEKYLDRCIESIVNQTYKNLEVLLIDDGSTDNSLEICNSWSKKDKRIKVFHQENRGVSSARNYGLKNSSGDYVSFIDSDDYLESNMYEIMLKKCNKKKYDVVVCNYYVKNSSTESLGINNEPELSWEEEMFEKGNLRGYLWNKLYSNDILKGKKFDENIHMMEDLIFNYELDEQRNLQYIYLDNALYHYVISKDSMTTNISPKKISALDALIKIIEILDKRDKKKLAARERVSFIIKYNLYNIIYNKEKIFREKKEYYMNLEKKFIKNKEVKKILTFQQKLKIMILKKFPILYKIRYNWK